MKGIDLKKNDLTCIDTENDIWVEKKDDNTFIFYSDYFQKEEIINILDYSIGIIEGCLNTYNYTLFDTSLDKFIELVNINDEFENNSRLFIAKCIYECKLFNFKVGCNDLPF